MGTCGVFDNRMDHGIFFYLEIYQIISACKISYGNITLSSNHRLSHAFSHFGGRRERSAILLSSTLGIARRCQGTEKIINFSLKKKKYYIVTINAI